MLRAGRVRADRLDVQDELDEVVPRLHVADRADEPRRIDVPARPHAARRRARSAPRRSARRRRATRRGRSTSILPASVASASASVAGGAASRAPASLRGGGAAASRAFGPSWLCSRRRGRRGRRRRGRRLVVDEVDRDRDVPLGVAELQRQPRAHRPRRDRPVERDRQERAQRERDARSPRIPEALGPRPLGPLAGRPLGGGRVRRRRGDARGAALDRVRPSSHASPRPIPHSVGQKPKFANDFQAVFRAAGLALRPLGMPPLRESTIRRRELETAPCSGVDHGRHGTGPVERPARSMPRPLLRHRSLALLTAATALVGLMGGAVGLGACGEQPAGPARPTSSAPPPEPVASVEAPRATVRDAAVAQTELNADGGTYDGPRIGALFLSTPVMSDMAWPSHEGREPRRRDRDRDRDPQIKSDIVGYIRQGGTVPVIPEPHKKENCQEGWYELVSGGFVCGKYASLDLNHPRLKIAPHAPDPRRAAALPVRLQHHERHAALPHGARRARSASSSSRGSRARRQAEARGLDTRTRTTRRRQRRSTPASRRPSSRAPPIRSASAPRTTPACPWYLRDYDGGKPQRHARRSRRAKARSRAAW